MSPVSIPALTRTLDRFDGMHKLKGKNIYRSSHRC
jgi:hypothetical protein